MLMLAWAQTRRRYATGRGDRRGRDEVRQTRPHVLRALRGSRRGRAGRRGDLREPGPGPLLRQRRRQREDRKSTRLNSSHITISYAVFCLKKKTTKPKLSQNPYLTMPASVPARPRIHKLLTL